MTNEQVNIKSALGNLKTGTIERAIELFGEGSQAITGDTIPKTTAAEDSDINALAMRLQRQAVIRKFVDFEKVNLASGLLRELPVKEGSIHCLMGGDFNAWDLVPAVLQLAGKPAKTLTIATLGFNKGNMTHLGKMLDDGDVKKAALLCSHYFQGTDLITYRIAKQILQDRGMEIAFCRNHCKIICIDAGAPYVIEGSANLRSCNNLEQFTISNSRPLFDFHAEWIARTISKSPC